MNKKKYAETDMYEPIKQMLSAQDFVVKGEVKGCDIAAVKDEAVWVVEMKLQFNITLLYQAMERLKITEQVFVAVPRPRRANDKNYRHMCRILEKLELGLIVVAMESPVRTAEIIMFPGGKPVRTRKKAASVRREVAGRTGDTPGGGVKTEVNTAYRERCIRIACILSLNETMNAPALIKRFHCDKDAYAIMRANYYGWFENKGKGWFSLTENGKKYLIAQAGNPVVAYYKMRAEESTDSF